MKKGSSHYHVVASQYLVCACVRMCVHVCAWSYQCKCRAGADSKNMAPLQRFYSSTNRRRVMRRSKTDFFVLRQTWQTCPIESIIVYVMRPMSHEFLGDVSSNTRTRSPTVKFLCDMCHFWRSCIIGILWPTFSITCM